MIKTDLTRKEALYVPVNETCEAVLELIKRTLLDIKRTPKSVIQNQRPLFLSQVRKAHTSLYFCVSEISQVLETDGSHLLARCITNLFNAFSELFENNNNYFQRVFKYFKRLEKKEDQILQFHKMSSGLDVQKRMAMFSIYQQGRSMMLHDSLSSKEKTILEFQSYEEKRLARRAKEIQKLKQDAIIDFQGNGLSLIQAEFNFMDEVDKTNLLSGRRKEFNEKVERCLRSIHDYEDNYLDMVFEPRVIMEVTQKVYEEMIGQSKKNIEQLDHAISSLSRFDSTQPTAIRELKILARQMRGVDGTFNISEDPKNSLFMRKEYVDEFLKKTQSSILDAVRKHNQKIALRAILIWDELSKSRMQSMSTQTYDNKELTILKKKLRDSVKRREDIEKRLRDKLALEKSRGLDLARKAELDSQVTRDRIKTLNQSLIAAQVENDENKLILDQMTKSIRNYKKEVELLEEKTEADLRHKEQIFVGVTKVLKASEALKNDLDKVFEGADILKETEKLLGKYNPREDDGERRLSKSDKIGAVTFDRKGALSFVILANQIFEGLSIISKNPNYSVSELPKYFNLLGNRCRVQMIPPEVLFHFAPKIKFASVQKIEEEAPLPKIEYPKRPKRERRRGSRVVDGSNFSKKSNNQSKSKIGTLKRIKSRSRMNVSIMSNKGSKRRQSRVRRMSKIGKYEDIDVSMMSDQEMLLAAESDPHGNLLGVKDHMMTQGGDLDDGEGSNQRLNQSMDPPSTRRRGLDGDPDGDPDEVYTEEEDFEEEETENQDESTFLGSEDAETGMSGKKQKRRKKRTKKSKNSTTKKTKKRKKLKTVKNRKSQDKAELLNVMAKVNEEDLEESNDGDPDSGRIAEGQYEQSDQVQDQTQPRNQMNTTTEQGNDSSIIKAKSTSVFGDFDDSEVNQPMMKSKYKTNGKGKSKDTQTMKSMNDIDKVASSSKDSVGSPDLVKIQAEYNNSHVLETSRHRSPRPPRELTQAEKTRLVLDYIDSCIHKLRLRPLNTKTLRMIMGIVDPAKNPKIEESGFFFDINNFRIIDRKEIDLLKKKVDKLAEDKAKLKKKLLQKFPDLPKEVLVPPGVDDPVDYDYQPQSPPGEVSNLKSLPRLMTKGGGLTGKPNTGRYRNYSMDNGALPGSNNAQKRRGPVNSKHFDSLERSLGNKNKTDNFKDYRQKRASLMQNNLNFLKSGKVRNPLKHTNKFNKKERLQKMQSNKSSILEDSQLFIKSNKFSTGTDFLSGTMSVKNLNKTHQNESPLANKPSKLNTNPPKKDDSATLASSPKNLKYPKNHKKVENSNKNHSSSNIFEAGGIAGDKSGATEPPTIPREIKLGISKQFNPVSVQDLSEDRKSSFIESVTKAFFKAKNNLKRTHNQSLIQPGGGGPKPHHRSSSMPKFGSGSFSLFNSGKVGSHPNGEADGIVAMNLDKDLNIREVNERMRHMFRIQVKRELDNFSQQSKKETPEPICDRLVRFYERLAAIYKKLATRGYRGVPLSLKKVNIDRIVNVEDSKKWKKKKKKTYIFSQIGK